VDVEYWYEYGCSYGVGVYWLEGNYTDYRDYNYDYECYGVGGGLYTGYEYYSDPSYEALYFVAGSARTCSSTSTTTRKGCG